MTLTTLLFARWRRVVSSATALLILAGGAEIVRADHPAPGTHVKTPQYTWRLAVLNGGQPRDAQVATITASGLRPFDQQLSSASWTLPSTTEDLVEAAFGCAGAHPIAADFNGDGFAQIGVYHEGQWFIDLNGNHRWDEGDLWVALGGPGDLPVVGDWDGDGKADIGVFGPGARDVELALLGDSLQSSLPEETNRRPVQPHLRTVSAGRPTFLFQRGAQAEPMQASVVSIFRFGTAGDLPVAADFRGDGTSSVGVYRRGQWLLDTSGNGTWGEGDLRINFGTSHFVPLAGDFSGTAVAQVALWSDGELRVRHPSSEHVRLTGGADLRPVAADFKGEGRQSLAFYREQP